MRSSPSRITSIGSMLEMLDAVVAVEELLDRVAQLLLALLRVAEPELRQPPRQRVDVLGRRVDEEARQPRHVLVGQASRRGRSRRGRCGRRRAAGCSRGAGRRGRTRGGRSSSSTRRSSGRRARAAAPASVRVEVEVGELRSLEELERQHPGSTSSARSPSGRRPRSSRRSCAGTSRRCAPRAGSRAPAGSSGRTRRRAPRSR